ncbi:diguanylate cyclase [Elizabethkingia ursingii]|nr:diguanylate cyclase [Elizabethkingia ursingii]
MLKKYWSYISNRHITDEMNKLEVIQHKTINQFTFFIALFFITDSIRDLTFDLVTNFYILFTIGCLLLFSFLFKRLRFNSCVIFSTCLFITLLVFYYSSRDGFDNGLVFYYFPILTGSLLVLNKKKDIIPIVIIYSSIFIFFLISHIYNFQFFQSRCQRNVYFTKNVRITTFVQVFVLLSLTGYFISNKHYKLVRLYQQTLKSEKIISELKKKLNGVFQVNIEDVVKLAMNNGVTFIPVFRQFFPFFYDNLLEVNPNMNNEEFKLCALLKLGFTTKDIAEYNHLAVRTVQGRKNRLRKSFNIPSDTDLYIWIENF